MKNALSFGFLVFAVLIVCAIEAVLLRWQRVLLFVAAFTILLLSIHFARARDLGQWQNSDPETRDWYQHLMQPDSTTASCCGEADAYWSDSFEVKDGHYVAIITDTRPDEPLRRPHIDAGTRIEIPDAKIKFGPNDPQAAEANKNPTGHGIVFLSRGGWVYCFVAPGGV